jgi:hypothetical protein
LTRKRVLRVFLLASALLTFVFALFVWLNIDLDLSAAYFAGEDLDHVRYVWVEINLMLGALAVGGVALLVALRQEW